MSHWCDNCNGWFEVDHYDEHGMHKQGEEYGWVGKLLALETLMTPLLDMIFACVCPHESCDADHEGVETRAREIVDWTPEEARKRLEAKDDTR